MTRFKQPSMHFRPTVTFALGREGPIVLGDQGKEQLAQFCELLNSTEHSELKYHLRQLVKAWQKSGPNLKKMMSGTDSNMPPNAHEIIKSFFTVLWLPTQGGRSTLQVMVKGTQPERRFSDVRPERMMWEALGRSLGGAAISTQLPDGTWMLAPVLESWVEFGFFTLNPHCEELAGPCPRCDNYYVKKRSNQKVYCSRRCGNAAMAVVWTAAKRKAEHDEKMIRAEALIQKWNSLKRRSGLVWKVWLKERDPSITAWFVTRRVRMRELPEPKGWQR
jgi:endogenous inhibitor of DNA gyrase (YacG/DUF329 family)